MSKQTGKGSRHQRRASAIERKATQHQDFVGQADVERAEAEFRKHERVQAEENHEVVREMAAEIEKVAGGFGFAHDRQALLHIIGRIDGMSIHANDDFTAGGSNGRVQPGGHNATGIVEETDLRVLFRHLLQVLARAIG